MLLRGFSRGHVRRKTMVSWTLAVAMLPSLLWLGHWSVRVPVPGTGSVIAIGMAAEHDAQRGEAGGHGEHCHGEASCNDAPAAPVGSGFGLLGSAFTVLAGCRLLMLAMRFAWQPGEDVPFRAPFQPPRSFVLA